MRKKTLLQSLQKIQTETLKKIKLIKNQAELEKLKRQTLGKGGQVPILAKELSRLPLKERAGFGKELNLTKNNLQRLFSQKSLSLLSGQSRVNISSLDPSFPGRKIRWGHLHPITQVAKRTVSIFQQMGFEMWEARLVDDKYHNFLSLNFPKGHPAMDMFDTLWINDNLAPIVHTSSMQNRVLKSRSVPIASVVVGRCFRKETTDATHEHTFHQLEGIFIDQNISVADMIGTLKNFLETFFERKLDLKIQPSYFPFVEPGIEIMAKCTFCTKSTRAKCQTCRGGGWIELLPAGMVHPSVLKEGGVDPQKYTGFAWAIGLDRLTMLTHKIDDIRWFHSGDLRFLRQF